MIALRTILEVSDNTGAKKVSCIGVLGRGNTKVAYIGDIITCNVKEVTPDAMVRRGNVVKAVIVRTSAPIRRPDGSYLRFDSNACVIIDDELNPKGTRVFGPVARELREKNFLKILSLAPEVV